MMDRTNGISFPFSNANTSGVNSFISNGTLGNANLKPEFTNSFEVGAELNFLKKINLNLSYYDNQTSDLLLYVPVAGSSGYVQSYMNAGKMENKGVEISANFIPVQTKDLNWNFTINFSKNNNKVLALADGVDNVSLNGFTGITIEAVKNQPFGEIFANSLLKDSKGRTVINDDKTDPMYGYPILSNTQVPLGSYLPNWIGSFSNSLTYKGLNFSFLLEVKNGGLMWNGTKGRMYGFGTHEDTQDRGTSTVFSGVQGHLDTNGNLVSTGAVNDISAVKNQTWYSTTGGGAGPCTIFVC